MLMSEAFEALLEACLKTEPGEFEPAVLRRSMKEVNEDMLPGLRILEKKLLDVSPLVSSPLNAERVGESVVTGVSTR